MSRVTPWLWLVPLLLAPSLTFAAAPLRWGADLSSNVPFAFEDPAAPTHVIGFEAEIIAGVAARLGRTAEFVQNGWGSLIPGLDRGSYDVAIDGLEITAEHAAKVDFSNPYLTSFEQIVVRRGTPGLTTMPALVDHRVGSLKASLAERLLQEAPGVIAVPYDSEIDAYSDLANGRLDAVLMDQPIAEYYAAPDPRLALVGGPIGQVRYAIAIAKGQAALVTSVNAALDDMRRTGELRRILERWKLWTPVMAAESNDLSPGTQPPIEYDRFIAASAPTTGWSTTLRRYAGFIPRIGWAGLVTLEISLSAMLVAVAVGLALALVRRYVGGVAGLAATSFIELIRGTPLLIQVLLIYYGLPSIGLKLDPFVAGVLALGLNYSAYEAENYRAGLEAVPAGQAEAATALNMTERQAISHVIVPQAIRVVLPVMTNDFISLLKDSSLVSVITLTELTQTYVQLSTTYYDYLGTGVMVGAAYLLLGLPFVWLARWAERRLAEGQPNRAL